MLPSHLHLLLIGFWRPGILVLPLTLIVRIVIKVSSQPDCMIACTYDVCLSLPSSKPASKDRCYN